MRRLCGSTLKTTPKLRKHLPPQRAFSGWYPRLLLMYNLILAVTSSRIFHKGKKCSPKTSWFAQLFHRAMHFSPLELSEANAGYTGSIIFPIIKSFRVFLLYCCWLVVCHYRFIGFKILKINNYLIPKYYTSCRS